MESLNKNGVSTSQEPGQEKYVTFIAGAFRGTEYFQYDYRHTDGELFSTVAKTLEECRKRRDEWLSRKNALLTYNEWWRMLNFDELEDITGIEQDRDGNNEEDTRFIDACNLFWDIKTFEEKTEIYHSHIKQQ